MNKDEIRRWLKDAKRRLAKLIERSNGGSEGRRGNKSAPLVKSTGIFMVYLRRSIQKQRDLIDSLEKKLKK